MVINKEADLLDDAAQGFAAIGAGPRLAVLKKLVRVGPQGLTVGELQKALDIPPSTLSHHLRVLANANLIIQTKQGRQIICAPNFTVIASLVEFLVSECCVEMGETSVVCRDIKGPK